MNKQNYPTNLTDNQWNAILQNFDDKRKRKHSLREILDAVFYLLKTGVCFQTIFPNGSLEIPNKSAEKVKHYFYIIEKKALYFLLRIYSRNSYFCKLK